MSNTEKLAIMNEAKEQALEIIKVNYDPNNHQESIRRLKSYMISVDDTMEIKYGVNKILNNIIDKAIYVKLYLDKSVSHTYPTKAKDFAAYLMELSIIRVRTEFVKFFQFIQDDFKGIFDTNPQLSLALLRLDELNKEYLELQQNVYNIV